MQRRWFERQKGLALAAITVCFAGCSLTAPSDDELMGGGSPDASIGDSSVESLPDGSTPDQSKLESGGDVQAHDQAVDQGQEGDSAGGCAPGTKPCASQCVPTNQPTTGCGQASCDACQFANASPICDSSQKCAIGQCVAGFEDCNGDPADGCETNLHTDALHCGSCATVCPEDGGLPVCNTGICGITLCPAGTGDCDGDKVNGCETDLLTSVDNCKACKNQCSFTNASATCVDGTCHLDACDSGFGNCDSNETNGCETDTQTSMAHCGSCASPCGAGPNGTTTCNAGQCKTVCNAGFGDCDGVAANGCESNLATDMNHCGSCSNPCTVQQGMCSAGVCGCPLPPANAVLAGPDWQYGFCWYLTKPGDRCDNVCAALGGTNKANLAVNAFPDSCNTPSPTDVSYWFHQNGNAANWIGTKPNSYRSFGHGNTGTTYAGKCMTGQQGIAGVFPGESNNNTLRAIVCPCF